MFKIKSLKARQILDSRGNPTVEAEMTLEGGGIVLSSVPSGASLGSKEAAELRDSGSNWYLGKGVLKAIENIKNVIAKEIAGKSFSSQSELDHILINLDGTKDKSNLGANSTLAVSVSFAKAMAKLLDEPLYKTLNKGNYKCKMPVPMLNILNGGLHADNRIDIQEFMIVPNMGDIEKNLEAAHRVFYNLKSILKKRGLSTNVGDEGGFAPDIESAESALDAILESIGASGLIPGEDVSIALDSAANEIMKQDGKYHLQGELMSSERFTRYYEELVSKYPICSIEDPMAESDLKGWEMITHELGGKIQIVGDDIFVTSHKYLQQGINSKIANSLLVKMNQVGTLTETFQAIDLARKNGYETVVSHRSGETEDIAIAHLAVAIGSKYIKTGSISRTDRICKYNELLRIAETL